MNKRAEVSQDIRSNGVEKEEQERQAPSQHLIFSNPAQRQEHIQAFLKWLPNILHDAPGICWEELPSRVMGYLIRNVPPDDPDAIPIALTIGCTMHAIKKESLSKNCRELTVLLRRLRTQYGMEHVSQLGTRSIWDSFVRGRTLSHGEAISLSFYDSLSSLHVRTYFEGLNERQRATWKPYALPQIPAGFIDKQKQQKAATAAAQQKRKEQTDVLTPLCPLLVEIAQLRKQATERLTKAFREQRDRVLAGEIDLPYHFKYTDHFFDVAEDASTLASVSLIEREITLPLTLWDKRSWVKAHPTRYGKSVHRRAEHQRETYAPEHALYFLQYHGPPEDLLWVGDLIAKRLLKRGKESTPEHCWTSRPAVLTPAGSDSCWLNRALALGDEVLFEPESLYRGVLYGCALATLALTNGSRVSELLQVSATRFETLVVDELKNQQPTGRKIGILVQHLLPKGYTQESERQFFLISEMAARLLREIGELLAVAHGGKIPVVHPSYNVKEEDLSREPYLFQWAASRDGWAGLLQDSDVGRLLRFLFHGLRLSTRTGQPIRIVTHLLRHVLATHMRHTQNVPAEAVAFLLHHRVRLSDSTRALTLSEATAYYSRMPMQHLLALLFDAQSIFTSQQACSYVQVPPLHTLEQMDEALRQIFEQWGMIGPTVFGYCSAGLCIRPNNRALCLNCPHLVPHYRNLNNAKTWRRLYVLQMQLHDAHGHSVDAQQAKQMIGYIDDIIRVMEIQICTRADGGYLPFADTLPSAQDDQGEVG
jgi:hypothetical protein